MVTPTSAASPNIASWYGASHAPPRSTGVPSASGVGPDPAADAVARLEHDDRLPGLAQPACGGEPGVPGADHTDVRLELPDHERER